MTKTPLRYDQHPTSVMVVPPTPTEVSAAATTYVLSKATDVADARVLLSALGLTDE